VYKVGVLYCKEGQTEETQMFNNCYDDASEEYKEFLSIIGETIQLENWTRFSADLDTSQSNLTGKTSIFAEWNEYENYVPCFNHVTLQTKRSTTN